MHLLLDRTIKTEDILYMEDGSVRSCHNIYDNHAMHPCMHNLKPLVSHFSKYHGLQYSCICSHHGAYKKAPPLGQGGEGGSGRREGGREGGSGRMEGGRVISNYNEDMSHMTMHMLTSTA